MTGANLTAAAIPVLLTLGGCQAADLDGRGRAGDGSGAAATTSGSDPSTGFDATTGGHSAAGATTGPAASTGPSDTSGSDASGAGEPEPGGSSTGAPAEGCPPTHVCFSLPGEFHVADELEPTAIEEFALPEGAEFSVLEVEVMVTHGGWYEPDPAGLHNILWLHRGSFDDFTWKGGVVGYVNVRGPGSNRIRTRHDLDVLDLADSQIFNIDGVALSEGVTYRVHYRYDTTAAEVRVEIHDGDTLVAQGTDVPTTDKIRNTDGGMFIWFGNGTDVDAPGPEVPSLGWRFADLRVELIP